ncbi:alpha/beta hydrolase [Mycoplasmatota bacterium]|nr:alpha/beta hydrolase [Mycoplasmatota bacterium]
MQVFNKEMVNIGGVEQFIQVTGNNEENPLLLMLHGGPGAPFSVLMQALPKEYEENFLVAHWDQRGAGNSYHDNILKETMNIEQIISDASEVVDYLLKKYQKDKIFLLGMSWGSAIGVQLANQIPEKLYAYIGTGQMVDTNKSEIISYDFLLSEVKKLKNEEAIQDLERIGRPPYKDCNDLIVQRKWFVGLGYGERKINTSKLYQEYCTSEELEKIVEGINFSNELLDFDLIDKFEAKNILELKIPIYLIVGKYDYQTAWELQESYFNTIKAPKKGLVWLEESGHSTIFEEPKDFVSELIKIKEEVED